MSSHDPFAPVSGPGSAPAVTPVEAKPDPQEAPEVHGEHIPTRARLDDLRKADLQALATRHGLTREKDDTRADLIDKLDASR